MVRMSSIQINYSIDYEGMWSQRERDRQTDRQGQTEGYRHRHRDEDRETETERQRGRHTALETDKDRHRERQRGIYRERGKLLTQSEETHNCNHSHRLAESST